MVTLKKVCPICDKKQTIKVREIDYTRWQQGTVIQRAFPYLGDADRELILTGMCTECWDNLSNPAVYEDEADDIADIFDGMKPCDFTGICPIGLVSHKCYCQCTSAAAAAAAAPIIDDDGVELVDDGECVACDEEDEVPKMPMADTNEFINTVTAVCGNTYKPVVSITMAGQKIQIPSDEKSVSLVLDAISKARGVDAEAVEPLLLRVKLACSGDPRSVAPASAALDVMKIFNVRSVAEDRIHYSTYSFDIWTDRKTFDAKQDELRMLLIKLIRHDIIVHTAYEIVKGAE